MSLRFPRVRAAVFLLGATVILVVQITLYFRYSNHTGLYSSHSSDVLLLPERIIHLDFKGGSPKLSFFRKLLPLLSSAGATGLLVEYEDYFPYSGWLRNLSSRSAWSPAEVTAFLKIAHASDLQVIPFVQTLGHLEFALKLPEHVYLRENPRLPDTACPSAPAVRHLISEMIRQVLSLHPQSKAIHLGMDEARLWKSCSRCQSRQGVDVFLEHVKWAVSKALKLRPEVRVLIWDDMFRYWPLERMFGVAQVWQTVQPVVWAYSRDVIIEIPARTWLGYQRTMPNLWIASAYMGADGHTALVPNVSQRLDNHIAWLKRSSATLISSTRSKSYKALTSTSSLSKVNALVLTGWTRYDHFGALCENLPLGVHSLVLMLSLVSAATPSDPVPSALAAERWKNLLNCPQEVLLPVPENLRLDPYLWSASLCSYPGSDLLRVVQKPIPFGLKYATTPDPNGPPGPKYMTYEEYQDLVEERNKCLRETGRLPEEIQDGGGKHSSQDRKPVITSNAANPCQMSPPQINTTAQQLRELQEKHPYLFNVLKSCPPDDLINRVFNDRYRSVYMVDYGREEEYPNQEYDRLVELAGQSANQALAFCPCRDSIKSKYPNDEWKGIVSATNRGKNECDALTVHKPQRRETAAAGGEEQNELCFCGETTNALRYGRYETPITKKDRAAEEFLLGRRGGDAEGGSNEGKGSCGWVSGGGGGGPSGGGRGGGSNKDGGGGGAVRTHKLSYNTEYNEAFGKLGELIISSRLHASGGKENKDPTTCK